MESATSAVSPPPPRPTAVTRNPPPSPSPTQSLLNPELKPKAEEFEKGEPEYIIFNYPPGADPILHTDFSCLYESADRPNQVCKVPVPLPFYLSVHDVEKRIFQRLGEHPNLVRITGMDEYGIWMERAQHGCLRVFYREGGDAVVTPRRRLRWCEDVACVLAFVHEKGVRHADLSGRNLLVDSKLRILLCDFSGSAIDRERAVISAEYGYRHPDDKEWLEPSIRCEIHALGSTLYEIITTNEPHHGVDKDGVDKLLKEGRYPDVSGILLGDVIQKCWAGGFESAAQVADAVASHYRTLQGFYLLPLHLGK